MNNSYIYNLEQIKDIENLELIAKFVIEGFITGLHKSPYHGFSVEFSEHRPYSPGESIRFIDWKLYAKTERLYVKKFEDETNLRSWFILDTSTSMLFPYKEFNKNSKLYFSIVCISALINLLKTQRDAVGLICFSNNIELFTKAKLSEVHINYLFTELKKLLKKDYSAEKNNSNISQTLHHVAKQINKRSLIIIFSDCFENVNLNDFIPALQHLRFNKHEVILFHILDSKYEINFNFQNRPYKFIDLETKEVKKVKPNEIKDEYHKYMLKKTNMIKEKCEQFQIDYILADINKGFHEVLVSYLLKRNKLF